MEVKKFNALEQTGRERFYQIHGGRKIYQRVINSYNKQGFKLYYYNDFKLIEIKTASTPIAIPPTSPIIFMKSLKPIKKRLKGIKQVANQETFLSIFKSYQKTFFKVSPREIKGVKVAKIPNKRDRKYILLSKRFSRPPNAEGVTLLP